MAVLHFFLVNSRLIYILFSMHTAPKPQSQKLQKNLNTAQLQSYSYTSTLLHCYTATLLHCYKDIQLQRNKLQLQKNCLKARQVKRLYVYKMLQSCKGFILRAKHPHRYKYKMIHPEKINI